MNILRLCEWSGVHADPTFWSRERREAVHNAALEWRQTHRLNALPVEWSGPDGCTLRSRQWVGVIEGAGGCIEIYPKTDASLLQKSVPNQKQAQSTLRSLLRLLEAIQYNQWLETATADLEVAELSFTDLWAYLLAKNLFSQLRRGLPHIYLNHESILPVVRGRIVAHRQISQFQDRIDQTICEWDEFSPDTPLSRLFKCACAFLRTRVSHPLSKGLLSDCLFLLDEVESVSTVEALNAVENFVWMRSNERFRAAFDLAINLLRGQGPQLVTGDAATWTFLVDMNQVFESFCRVALEERFGIIVEEQPRIGYLLQPQTMWQIPDYVWSVEGQPWIGDAKWKSLTDKTGAEEAESEIHISATDIRQLTTYAALFQAKQKNMTGRTPELAIFYPRIGAAFSTRRHRTWNDSRLHVVPIRVSGWSSPADVLPVDFSLTK